MHDKYYYFLPLFFSSLLFEIVSLFDLYYYYY